MFILRMMKAFLQILTNKITISIRITKEETMTQVQMILLDMLPTLQIRTQMMMTKTQAQITITVLMMTSHHSLMMTSHHRYSMKRTLLGLTTTKVYRNASRSPSSSHPTQLTSNSEEPVSTTTRSQDRLNQLLQHLTIQATRKKKKRLLRKNRRNRERKAMI